MSDIAFLFTALVVPYALVLGLVLASSYQMVRAGQLQRELERDDTKEAP